MSIQQAGVLLAAVGALAWLVCVIGLACYGIAWSQRHRSAALVSAVCGAALTGVGVYILSTPLIWS